jgi:RNA polymerase sigma-70 factor (ECF subfamily)
LADAHSGVEAGFFHWLTRILESKLVDAHRFFHAAGRDVNREVPAAERPSAYESLAARVAADSLTPSRIVARHEVDSLVAAALAGLSANYRRVLELRFLKGHSVAEAAEMMGRTEGAIQMLSARALRRLRESLSQLSRVEF